MFLPSKLKEGLGDNIIMTKSVDKCIALYPANEWTRFTEKLGRLPEMQSRSIKRFIYSAACEAVPDSQGRILLPQNLKEYAGIEKNVTVIGAGDHAEIWDEKLWAAESEKTAEDDMASMLIGLGF